MCWISVRQIYKRAPPACMFHATFAQIPLIKSDQPNPKHQHPPNSHQLLRNPFPKSFGHICLHSITNPVARSGLYFFSATSRPLPDVAYINFSKPKRNVPIRTRCCEVGSEEYRIGSPIINNATINLENGRKLKITVQNQWRKKNI